jgi:hypothetical protein
VVGLNDIASVTVLESIDLFVANETWLAGMPPGKQSLAFCLASENYALQRSFIASCRTAKKAGFGLPSRSKSKG